MKAKFHRLVAAPETLITPALQAMAVLTAGIALFFSLVEASPLRFLFPSYWFSSDSIVFLCLSVILMYLAWDKAGEPSKYQLPQTQDLDSRLSTLTKALAEAGQTVGAIEAEIESRQVLVTQLERQKIVAEEAIRLSREQVDAVSALLSEKVSRENQAESRRALIRDFLFLIAGIAIPLIIQAKPNP